jgi:hypothetical protein
MYGIVRDERMVVDNEAGPQDERREAGGGRVRKMNE